MNKKMWLTISIFVVLALLATACSAASYSNAPQSQAGSKSSEGQRAVAPEAARDAGGVTNTSYTSQVPEAKRLVITNANISIAVDDPSASMERISAMAEEMKGFVVSSNLTQDRLDSGIEVPAVNMTIRVPAERLKEAMDRIKAETKRPVISESTQSQDITKEYTDLQSRLHNLEAAQARLQTILDGATKTEDVLSVYRELTSVEEQIEVIKGQIQFYEQSAALSAITIALKANEAVQPITIGGWQPVGVARDAIQTLVTGLKVLATIGIYMVLLVLPLLLVIALPFYVLYRLLRRRKKAPLPPAPAQGA